MIYIRADANDKIGIGHMMRCFSIAQALRKRGTEATFFVADRSSAKMAAEAGFGYVCLNSDYDHGFCSTCGREAWITSLWIPTLSQRAT